MLVQPRRAAESVAEEQGTAAHHRREVLVPSLMMPWDHHCIWPHPCLVGWPFRPWHTTPCSWTSCNRSQNRDLMSTTGSDVQRIYCVEFVSLLLPQRGCPGRGHPGVMFSLMRCVPCCHHLFIEANSSLKCYYGTLKPETDLQAGKPVALPAEGTKCTNTRGRRQCKLCHPGEYPRAE